MRRISQKRRDGIALRFALFAVAAILSGILGAILVSPQAGAPVFPIAGLVVYVLSAHRAMRLWQGSRRSYPHRDLPRGRPIGVVAIAVMMVATGRQAIQDVPKTHAPPATRTAEQTH